MATEINSKHGELKFMVYVVAVTAALAGLLFGLDIGVISGALPFISKQFKATTEISELIVSSLLGGAVIGTFISGPVSMHWGRKIALLISAVIFIMGSFLSSVATSTSVLVGVRFFLGIAVGMASFTAPLYLSEMAPQRIRGALISLYQLMITIGILMAFLSDTALSYGGHWRWMLGALVVPATVMFIGISVLPRSPRWLMLKGFEERARNVLKKLRVTEAEVDQEINDIKTTLQVKQKGFQFLKNSNFRRVILLGFGLQVAQQFTGINIMMYYAPKIFKIAGFASTQEQMFGTVLVGAINMLATFIAIAFVDKFGRRPILIMGYITMSVCLLIVGTLLFEFDHATLKPTIESVHQLVAKAAPAVYQGPQIGQSAMQFAAIAFLLIFIIGFSCSAGPIIWVVCSEIYPLGGRDLGITISTATNWFANMIVGATFLTMLDKLGNGQTFWLFGLLNVGFIFLIWLFCPETKGISLEEIEENLMAGRPLKKIGS